VVKTVLPRSGKLSLARRFNAGIAMARVNIFVASRRSNPLASLRDAAKVMAAFVPALKRRAKLSLPLRGTSGPLSSVKIRG